jgi:glycosyltransferase involved in cell wall biosynthesis
VRRGPEEVRAAPRLVPLGFVDPKPGTAVKLAHLSMRFPPGPGGVERHVREVTRRLAARGNEVSVFTSDLYQEFPMVRLARDVPRAETLDGVRVRRLHVTSLPGELHYPFFWGMGRALKDEAPDLVHVHTYGTHHASVARRFHRRTRTPYVLSAHYHPIWSIYGGAVRHQIRGFYDRRLAAPVVAGASRLIVESREEERLLRENGFPLPPVEVIPPGYTPLPTPASPGAFASTFGIPGPFVLFVGRLASNKGLVPLVEAFATLANHDPTATLVLVGEDGGMQAAVEQRARERNLSSRVRLTGFVSDERLLAGGFRDARLLVLPSEYEAFGLVLLESLAQGTPVIASRVGGIPEFLEDGKAGRLVPPQEIPALAEALLGLWDDAGLRRRMGEFGRTQVVPRFSWETVVDRFEAVYRQVRAG